MQRLVVVIVACATTHAFADPSESSDPNAGTVAAPTTNRINMRIGGSTSDSTSRPTICLDVRIIAGFGVESCGTGQGVIHDEPGTELAHFRGTLSVFERQTPQGLGRLRAGLGFAELQVGVDHPGFHFGQPDSADRGSVAGPEASLQGQWLVPLGKGVDAIASFTAGVAVFADADKLVTPRSNVQPFVSVEVGVGW